MVCAVFIHKHHREGMGLDSGWGLGGGGGYKRRSETNSNKGGWLLNHDTHLVKSNKKCFLKKKIQSKVNRVEQSQPAACSFRPSPGRERVRESPLRADVKWFLPPVAASVLRCARLQINEGGQQPTGLGCRSQSGLPRGAPHTRTHTHRIVDVFTRTRRLRLV